MNLNDAKNMAINFMNQYGLLNNGWSFQFDRGMQRLGCCNYKKKCISLSAPIAEINEEEIVKNTILHEIAHALAFPFCGHGYHWKNMCMKIGAKAKRTSDCKNPVGKYIAVCPTCGKETYFYRKVKRNYLCSCRTRLVISENTKYSCS